MAKRIITISREFGSGGRFIGEEVAKKLGIAYYDKNIINQYLHRQMQHKSDYLQRSEFPVHLHKREAVTTVYRIHTCLVVIKRDIEVMDKKAELQKYLKENLLFFEV